MNNRNVYNVIAIYRDAGSDQFSPCRSRQHDSSTEVWHIAAKNRTQAMQMLLTHRWFQGEGPGIIERWENRYPPSWKRYDGSTYWEQSSFPGQALNDVELLFDPEPEPALLTADEFQQLSNKVVEPVDPPKRSRKKKIEA